MIWLQICKALFVNFYFIFYSMDHRKYNSKKKTTPNALIKIQDFVKFRNDKERIINNPFEENWKKAIVFQELLELYKPHENNFMPNNTSYDKKDFENFHRYQAKFDEEDSMWENNEDYQLNKLYKMTEGINNYEEQFQNHKIIKTAQKIEVRDKNHRHNVQSDSGLDIIQKGNQKQICTKQSKIYFRKQNLKEFELFIDFKEKPRKNFLVWKSKIKKMQKQAIQQYGVTFQKEENTAFQSVDYAQYKKREDAIFQKFIRLSSQKSDEKKEPVNNSDNFPLNEMGNIPTMIPKQLMRPNTSCQTSPVKFLREHSKSREKIRKKYFRVPAA